MTCSTPADVSAASSVSDCAGCRRIVLRAAHIDRRTNAVGQQMRAAGVAVGGQTPPWNDMAAATRSGTRPATTSDVRPPMQYPVVPNRLPETSGRAAKVENACARRPSRQGGQGDRLHHRGNSRLARGVAKRAPFVERRPLALAVVDIGSSTAYPGPPDAGPSLGTPGERRRRRGLSRSPARGPPRPGVASVTGRSRSGAVIESLIVGMCRFYPWRPGRSRPACRSRPYEDPLRLALEQGTPCTGTGTRSLFGHQLRYDLSAGFPLITTKKVHTKSVIYELLWFLRGDSNVEWLQRYGVTIWDEWASETGDLGPVYGVQWRSAHAVRRASSTRSARRSTCCAPTRIRGGSSSAWNVAVFPGWRWPLPRVLPVHVADNKLSCQLYQRSADMFLGVPFNIASYALLTHMMAAQPWPAGGDFICWTGGTATSTTTTSNRSPNSSAATPRLIRNSVLRPGFDLRLHLRRRRDPGNYDPHPAIKAPVAVQHRVRRTHLGAVHLRCHRPGRRCIPWRVPEDLARFGTSP